MKQSDKTSSVLLIGTAKSDARKSVSKWRWGVIGLCLSFLPSIKFLVLGIVVLIAHILIPKIDLSTSERVEIYSQQPALYTASYRKTAKTVRFMSIFYGWLVGVICCMVFFYLL